MAHHFSLAAVDGRVRVTGQISFVWEIGVDDPKFGRERAQVARRESDIVFEKAKF